MEEFIRKIVPNYRKKTLQAIIRGKGKHRSNWFIRINGEDMYGLVDVEYDPKPFPMETKHILTALKTFGLSQKEDLQSLGELR